MLGLRSMHRSVAQQRPSSADSCDACCTRGEWSIASATAISKRTRRASSAQAVAGGIELGDNPTGGYVMKFTLKRSLVAASIGIAAVVTPLALTAALTGVSKAPGAVAGATGTQSSPDQILYGQVSGTPSDFYQYVPGNGSAPTTQTVTPKNGNCGTPTVSGAPL